jgi:succinate dehydrogenase / fumarate reductase cytochrome b subunit
LIDAAPIRAMSGALMSTHAATAVPQAQKTPLFQSRLGSFLAVFPLSIWVVNHLWDNLAAFRGGAAWQSAVTDYKHPYSQIATFVMVMLPLLFHTGWGIVRLLSFKPNLKAYPNYGNLKYILQRLAGVGVLFFVGAHLWLAFLQPRLVYGGAEPFAAIAYEMRWHLPTILVYTLGILGTAYHLANGIQGFAMGWGLLASERSMRRFEPWSIGIFLVLLAMGWGALFALFKAGETQEVQQERARIMSERGVKTDH